MRSLLLLQGLYFIVTAVWPLVGMRTFEQVTGPKSDRWLVKTVAVLIGVIGGVLLSASWSGRVSPEVVFLATGSAAGLGVVDVTQVAHRQ